MRKHLLPLIAILTIAGILAFLLQDYARHFIAPTLFLLWIGRLLLESIPQVIIWGVFVAIALIIAGRSLLKRGSIPRPIRRAEAALPGRIGSWVKLIQQADQEAYYKWQLAQPLSELIVAVLAHHERLTPKQIREKLVANNLDLPPELQAYLQASVTSFSHLLAPRSRFRPGAPASPLDHNLEQIAQFLEDKLDYQTD